MAHNLSRYEEKYIGSPIRQGRPTLNPFTRYYLLRPSLDSVEVSLAAKNIPSWLRRILAWRYRHIPVIRKKISVELDY